MAEPEPEPDAAAVGAAAGVAQASAWAPELSCDKLTLGDGGATATRGEGCPSQPAALVVVAASWGAFGSIPGSPGFSSFPAPLMLTLGARRCPQVPALMPHRSRW